METTPNPTLITDLPIPQLVNYLAHRLTTWWESPDAYKASLEDAERQTLEWIGVDPDWVMDHPSYAQGHDDRYEDWCDGYSDGVQRHVSMLLGWMLVNYPNDVWTRPDLGTPTPN